MPVPSKIALPIAIPSDGSSRGLDAYSDPTWSSPVPNLDDPHFSLCIASSNIGSASASTSAPTPTPDSLVSAVEGNALLSREYAALRIECAELRGRAISLEDVSTILEGLCEQLNAIRADIHAIERQISTGQASGPALEVSDVVVRFGKALALFRALQGHVASLDDGRFFPFHITNRDRHWCDGCRCEFPLKRLKGCGACRSATYCSVACQALAWKDGHKNLCREIIAQTNLLKGWGRVWNTFLGWITVRALDFTNRPENYHNHCFEIRLRKTGSNDLSRAYEVLGGRVEPLDVGKDVHFESSLEVDEDTNDRLYTALLVVGKNNELTDAIGLSWGLPISIHDTPKRSEMWAKHCVGIMKLVVAHGKPRRAIRDATTTMETIFLMRGEPELCSTDALHGRG